MTVHRKYRGGRNYFIRRDTRFMGLAVILTDREGTADAVDMDTSHTLSTYDHPYMTTLTTDWLRI